MHRVLVAYASSHGSTAEIAEAIADKLREYQLSVDCVPAGLVTSLAGYDAVVLGSAVYHNRWRLDARRFLDRYGSLLAQLPLWAFSSGPVGEGEPSPSWHCPHRTLQELHDLHARGHVVFGGRVSGDRRHPVEWALSNRLPPAFRDRRDWGEVRTWAAEIAQELTSAATTAR